MNKILIAALIGIAGFAGWFGPEIAVTGVERVKSEIAAIGAWFAYDPHVAALECLSGRFDLSLIHI